VSTQRAAPIALLLAVASVAVAAEPSAEHDYLLSCAGCHKLDGTGSANVPTLIGVDRLLERDGGRDYLMRVPGVAQAPLSDMRLAALLNWLLGYFGAARPTPRFTATEVSRARTAPLDDPRQGRAELFTSTP
jgi:hypothetical protein